MALPTVGDAKSYLRIETADEDSLVSQLLARAKAAIEGAIGYPFLAAATTIVLRQRYRSAELTLPGPFALLPTPPVVTDVNGVVVDATTYALDPAVGKIWAKYGGSIFGALPYTVTATIGLSAHPAYDSRYEAIAATAILDLVAHSYQNRNPAVQSESDEGGSSVNLHDGGIPPRIQLDLLLLPCTRGMVAA